MPPFDTIISQPPGSAATPQGKLSPNLEITPDLVKKVADLVYAALQRDLAIERERARWSQSTPSRGRGRAP